MPIDACSPPPACRAWTSIRRSLAAVVQSGEEEVESRLDRLEREHALVRFVGELEAPDRTLTLHYRFAHHMYQNAFFESLRATRKAALEPRDRRAPGGSVRRADGASRRHRGAVRSRARRRARRRILEPRRPGCWTALRARRIGAPGAARAQRCSRTSRTVQRARPPSSGCR